MENIFTYSGVSLCKGLIVINSVLGSPKLGKLIEQIHFAMFKAVILDSRGGVGERGENGEGKEGVDGRGGSR